jgi:hypothetical protein
MGEKQPLQQLISTLEQTAVASRSPKLFKHLPTDWQTFLRRPCAAMTRRSRHWITHSAILQDIVMTAGLPARCDSKKTTVVHTC